MPSTPRRTPGGQTPGSRGRGPSAGPGGGRPAAGGRAGASRPVPQRRTAGAPGRRARRRGALTGRAAVLALVVSALVLTLAYPAQRYLAQQAQLSELERDLAAQKASIAALEVRREKWDDPAYVKAQARQRLQYVMPGEVAYVIIDPARDAAEASAPSSVSRVRADGPWYGRLWSGVRAADRPATVPGAP